jgi:hypothetical protein
MRYIDVKWLHENEGDPVRLVSEMDLDGYETRKLEFFTNGDIGFACPSGATLGVELGVAPVPSIEEINAIDQFEGTEICAADFETLWIAGTLGPDVPR